jgi:hypothetical protein
MITLIARLMAVVLIAFALTGVPAAFADMYDMPPTSDAPNGFAVGGCPDFTMADDQVVQLRDIATIPDRHGLTVTEFLRAFRGIGGNSQGGSEDTSSPGM